MSKLSIRDKQVWASAIDKIAASYGYSQIASELIDTSEPGKSGKSKVEYSFTLCSNTRKEDIYKLVIEVQESEGPPKKDNLYCFDAGTKDIPGILTYLFVPVDISIDEFNMLIDNIVLTTLYYLVYTRVNNVLATNVEQLALDIRDKRDISSYTATGSSIDERVKTSLEKYRKRLDPTGK